VYELSLSFPKVYTLSLSHSHSHSHSLSLSLSLSLFTHTNTPTHASSLSFSGSFLCEYLGELVDQRELTRRFEGTCTHFLLFFLLFPLTHFCAHTYPYEPIDGRPTYSSSCTYIYDLDFAATEDSAFRDDEEFSIDGTYVGTFLSFLLSFFLFLSLCL